MGGGGGWWGWWGWWGEVEAGTGCLFLKGQQLQRELPKLSHCRFHLPRCIFNSIVSSLDGAYRFSPFFLWIGRFAFFSSPRSPPLPSPLPFPLPSRLETPPLPSLPLPFPPREWQEGKLPNDLLVGLSEKGEVLARRLDAKRHYVSKETPARRSPRRARVADGVRTSVLPARSDVYR